MDQEINELQASYNQVAADYVTHIFHELEHKPLDRELLDRFAAQVHSSGPVAELGCGPGHVARYLHNHGVNILGIDLSPRMVELARQLNPGIEFRQGNMASLDVDDEAWAAIVAFYSIIHIPRDKVTLALQEFKRVLRPGGFLLLSFHIGQETRHVDDLWGNKVSLDFVFFEPSEMESYLRTANFAIEDTIERQPYPDVEVPTRRAYIFARKPAIIK